MDKLLKTFLLSGGFFGVVFGLFIGFMYNRTIGIMAGVSGGIFFGFCMSAFFSYQTKKFKEKSKDIVGDENPIHQGGANHFFQGEAVGGWLYMTEDAMIFKSHNINIHCHQLTIPYDQISDVKLSGTLGLIPNGLTITVNGIEERFVVWERKVWLQKINDARTKNRSAKIV